MSRIAVLALAALATTAAGCGSSSSAGSSSSSPTSAATTIAAASGAVNPNQRETLPPGDIPDTIAYVPYTDPATRITVSTPEGWSRSTGAGAITFTDKLNEVRLFSQPGPAPVTVASVRAGEVPKIAATARSFKLQSVTSVSRPAGSAVRIAYLADSKPDPVTGKVGTLAFERYDFFHRGREVVLLLSSPNGSDNVDPWRKVTTSLSFGR
jgi:hypothetical protein